jgi:hypothetical protein
MVKRRRRHLWAELLLVPGICELEESQSATVTDLKEAMTLSAYCTKQLVGLAPRRNQREAEKLLIKTSGYFEILSDVGIMMQSVGDISMFAHRSPLQAQ